MHEHVFIMTTEITQNYPEDWGDEARREADAIDRLNELKARGVDSIVDLTVLGPCRSRRGRVGRRRLRRRASGSARTSTGRTACSNSPSAPARSGENGSCRSLDEMDPCASASRPSTCPWRGLARVVDASLQRAAQVVEAGERHPSSVSKSWLMKSRAFVCRVRDRQTRVLQSRRADQQVTPEPADGAQVRDARGHAAVGDGQALVAGARLELAGDRSAPDRRRPASIPS